MWHIVEFRRCVLKFKERRFTGFLSVYDDCVKVFVCRYLDIYTIVHREVYHWDLGEESRCLHPADSGEAAAEEVTLRISMSRKKILQIMILMRMKSARCSSPQMPALPLLPLPCCAATEEVVLIFLPLVSTRSLRGEHYSSRCPT